MLVQMRDRTVWRRALVALSMFALAMKILIPQGFMPGTSLADPIVMCGGQGPMPMAMPMAEKAHGEQSKSGKGPHGGMEHPCDFASLGAPALAATLDGAHAALTTVTTATVVIPALTFAPGRGMAAPPPPVTRTTALPRLTDSYPLVLRV